MADIDDDFDSGGAPLAERAPSPHLAALSEKARDYARNARSENTRRAYDADWRQYAAWLRRQGLDPLPPDTQTVGLYLAACVEGSPGRDPLSVASLERRLSGICWRYRQLGAPLDTSDRHISTVLAGIRRAHGRPPTQKEAIFADELLAMLATLEMDLRGLRDRAILAIGFSGGLRRSALARRAEVGGPWRVALRAGHDPRPTRAARLPRAAVDPGGLAAVRWAIGVGPPTGHAKRRREGGRVVVPWCAAPPRDRGPQELDRLGDDAPGRLFGAGCT